MPSRQPKLIDIIDFNVKGEYHIIKPDGILRRYKFDIVAMSTNKKILKITNIRRYENGSFKFIASIFDFSTGERLSQCGYDDDEYVIWNGKKKKYIAVQSKYYVYIYNDYLLPDHLALLGT